jgi:hypothetical protein
MRRKIALLLVSLLAAITLTQASGSPVYANSLHGCGSATVDNVICLWRNTNYASDKWISSFQNIYNHPNNCLNIAPAEWSNGEPVNDNSWSLVVNGDNTPTNVWRYYDIYVFNWIDCNVDGGVDTFSGAGEASYPNLTIPYYVNHTNIHLAKTITSIELIPHA